MFKTFLVCLLGIINVFAIVLPGDDVDTFKTEVNNLYHEYIFLEDIATEEYEYTVVFGQMADKMTFGVYLNSIGSISEHLVVKLDSKTLNVNKNIDQIIKIIAFEARGNEITFTLRNSSTNTDISSKTFNIIDYEGFKALDSYEIKAGLNQGKVTDIIVINTISNSFKKFYLILLGIIFFMSLILIFAKTKNTGLFNKETREDVVQYSELVDQAKKVLEAFKEEELKQERLEEEKEEKKEDEGIKEVYKKELRYDTLDEIEGSFDIENHLKEKGFDLDYPSLLEDEKNEIMVELMLLKNLGKITEEEYTKETIKLWKK